MNTKIVLTGLLASSLMVFSFIKNNEKVEITTRNSGRNHVETPILQTDLNENTIQVALLLDTSNSMDGLIEQAKSRLWNIVNTLTTLKYNGKTPKIEISLYEYGNDGISNNQWVRKVTPLTQDLDLISEKLFALRTNGGSEYCGAVIKSATNELEWNQNNGMKLIYIAGNEPFNQQLNAEGINFKEAISNAKKKNIYINTIFCGNREEGIGSFWQEGAVLGEGKYFNIDSNQKVIYIETPYDRKISECNVTLNETYIGYGSKGVEKKAVQTKQDENAKMLSGSNAVERVVSKSRKEAYNNASWDMVDKAEKDKNFVKNLKTEELPQELKGKSKAEIQKMINEKSEQRSKIQKEIAELSIKRQEFIDAEMKKKNNTNADDLGVAMEKSIKKLALKNGYKF